MVRGRRAERELTYFTDYVKRQLPANWESELTAEEVEAARKRFFDKTLSPKDPLLDNIKSLAYGSSYIDKRNTQWTRTIHVELVDGVLRISQPSD